MAGSLEAIGGQAGGGAVRDFLAVAHNSDGSKISANLVTDTYSTSITPDASKGDWHTVVVTNSTAFTINAPANAPAAGRGAVLVVEVSNSSGGAMGVITWNAAFQFAGVTWANPANGKSRFAEFRWNGAVWVCIAAASAGY